MQVPHSGEKGILSLPGNQLLQKKAHKELLEKYDRRAQAAVDYITAVRPALDVQTGPLLDPKVPDPVMGISSQVAYPVLSSTAHWKKGDHPA